MAKCQRIYTKLFKFILITWIRWKSHSVIKIMNSLKNGICLTWLLDCYIRTTLQLTPLDASVKMNMEKVFSPSVLLEFTYFHWMSRVLVGKKKTCDILLDRDCDLFNILIDREKMGQTKAKAHTIRKNVNAHN